MAFDPIKQFLQYDGAEDTNALDLVTGQASAPAPAPSTIGEAVAVGAAAGAENMASDVEYFKGLLNVVTGDEEAAAQNIRLAEQSEQAAARATSGTQSFEEFYNEPTVEGFITQIGKLSGQTVPFALTTIAGGGIGGVIAKSVGKKAARKAADRIVRDSLERTAAGAATPDERLIAQAAYDYAKKGAFAGAFGVEYVSASAGGARESLASGRDLNTDEAFRAFLVGAPIAAVGAGGEAAILKAVATVARNRSVKDRSLFAQLAQDIATTAGRSAAIEAGTETVQEAISVANRASMDDSFTAQDAAMRLGEAAFAGFFSGGAVGALGGAAGSVLSNRDAIADSAPITAVANVIDKARRYIDSGQTQQFDQQVNAEQYGDVMSGYTTPEPQADINAQLSAMVDETSSKEAVWIAGDTPQYQARTGKPTEITVNGELAYAAFVPGRGTIVSTNKNVVESVVASNASDQSLSDALGYSKPKNAAQPGDTVVQVVDRDGGVVSEEVTDSAGLADAFGAATRIMPEGGSIRQTTVEKALEERNKRVEREQGPVVRDIDSEELSSLKAQLSERTDVQEADIETVEVGTFNIRRDPNETFANTDSARAEYEATFGETDWDDPFFGSMTEALLQKAVDEQIANPTADVKIEQADVKIDQGGGKYDLVRKYRLIREGLPVDPTESSPQFVAEAVNKARRSKFARTSPVVVVRPDGKAVKVNMVDLTNAGRRLVQERGDSTFQGDTQFESSQKGLQEILADLRLEGYDVLVNGTSLYDVQGRLPDAMNVVAGRAEGTNVRLRELLAPRSSVAPSQGLTVIAYEVAEDGTRTDNIVAMQRNVTPEAADAFERFYERFYGQRQNYDVVRIGGEFDPNDMPVEEIGQTEIERMMGDPRDDTAGIDRRVGRAPSTSGAAPVQQIQFADSDVAAFVADVLSTIKLRVEPLIFNVEQLLAASDEQLRATFTTEADYRTIRNAIQDFRTRPKLFGRSVTGLNGRPVIMLREQANPLQTALSAGHELGHVMFAEHMNGALDQRALRAALLKTYKKDKEYQSYVTKYNEERGFDEWYADQVAKWASRRFVRKQAKSLVERHFKQLVDKIKSLYRSMDSIFKRRLTGKVDQQFDQFMDAVLEARRDGKTFKETAFAKKQLAREMERAVVEQGGEALAAHWRKKIADVANNPNVRPLLKFVRTADGVLRGIAGNKLANMFYVRSQDKAGGGDLGFLGAKARKVDDLQNKFEKDVGSLADENVQAAIAEAATSEPTASLSPMAQSVRKFLDDIYVDYIEPSNTNIGRQQDFFPTVINLMEAVEREDDFISIIVANNPGITAARAREAVQRLREFNHSIQNDGPVDFNATNPASSVEQARQLTANVPRELLQEQGFLQDPKEALVSYVRHVATRVEWNAHTKDANGVDMLEPELAKLSERDRAEVEGIIATYLGYQSNPIGPVWRKVNSYGQFLQFVTILPFATLASLPELAGPVINSKELNFDTFVTAFKEIGASIKNRAESQQFARDIGVITSEVVANTWITEAEQDFMDPKVRKMSDWYFNAIGLNWYTKFTREFAAGMGVQFIIRHAENKFNNPRSERYLQELGLTAEDVKKWDRSNRRLDTPEGKKVTKALQRFVESSILRPNAAERPIWASDPRWALVWQLKSFMYAYQKVIVGGVLREMRNRTSEGAGTGMPQLTATTAVLALTAIATMPLAMLALELREYAKYGLASIIPGAVATDRYFRSDNMDWGQYFVEIFDRSGFMGPFAVAGMMHQNSEWGKNPLLPLAGPTAETVDKLIDNGFDITKTIGSRLPLTFASD